jgi:hypothetical protein
MRRGSCACSPGDDWSDPATWVTLMAGHMGDTRRWPLWPPRVQFVDALDPDRPAGGCGPIGRGLRPATSRGRGMEHAPRGASAGDASCNVADDDQDRAGRSRPMSSDRGVGDVGCEGCPAIQGPTPCCCSCWMTVEEGRVSCRGVACVSGQECCPSLGLHCRPHSRAMTLAASTLVL